MALLLRAPQKKRRSRRKLYSFTDHISIPLFPPLFLQNLGLDFAEGGQKNLLLSERFTFPNTLIYTLVEMP